MVILKAIILVICFGGAYVALSKPFNLKATTAIFGLALAILVFAYTGGVTKIVAALAIVAALIAIFSGRLSK